MYAGTPASGSARCPSIATWSSPIHSPRAPGALCISTARGAGAHDDDLEATAAAGEGDSRSGRVAYALRRLLIGPALRSTAIAEELMGRLLALAVLSPDALSSVAYGPEAMMAILVLAGSGELKLSLPIGAALAVLMLSVGLGYRQVIRAYPHGGGSYIVASDSLGHQWGLLAGAGLIVDYILTVAVSVASGVEAITSAIPSLDSARVAIGLVVIVLLVAGNLRGVRDAGAAFAAPTYLFVGAIALIVIAGLIKAGSHGFHPAAAAPHRAIEAVGVLLLLRAFASGATAMTGIEVISNAVPVFRPPQAKHARQTLSVMIGLLISMFVGVVLVAHFDGATPVGARPCSPRSRMTASAAASPTASCRWRPRSCCWSPPTRRSTAFRACCTSWPATATSLDCSCAWAIASRSATASSCSRSPRP